MKNKSFYIRVVTSVFFLGMLSMMGIQAVAQENGGAIGTKGEIILQEETAPSSETSASTTDTASVTTKSGPSGIASSKSKPKGRYPSTGELAKTSLSIAGLISLIAALLLFIWKRKSKRKGVKEDEV
ncbi:LPXTG-domain-containing protein cell wall anchor domain [Enterococcus moraviensis ATCC BAA-383]|uniref:LPXTG-domain-containing protein cell wall anchor domain n=1 Tax=Enterococcus moraviensis ATCC BAA-383 TaxID=1158609 RepID=R2RGJ5_9ENTE|nr:LPXTG cell wall anchor domain-containing protein [Enterococcus moraviensis]EOI06781.1 LPXTG-domain-containing protein cell wall anchor domain [Enterococcus moraviensis ATCC BAA-383]EOT65118.1 hypothetical protein I586_02852 [Enterococcus moraviensis ATCC BAA-383]OJG66963.1 LPXTG-domain-containing protein cell wall anchor domain [Enterococcus moraviensis]